MSSGHHLVQIRFAFPSRLSLNQAAFAFVYDKCLTSVAVASYLSLQTQDFAPDEGDQENSPRLAPLQDLQAYHPAPHNVMNRKVHFRTGTEYYLEDVTDSIGITRIDVTFEVEGAPDPSPPALKRHVETGLARARFFMRTYRAETQEVDVVIPNEGDSPLVEIGISEDYQFDEAGIHGRFKVVSRTLTWKDPIATGITKQMLPQEKVAQLAAALRKGEPPAVHLEILCEARYLSQVRAQHALSIVLAGTAFEVYLRWRLGRECEMRGITSLTSPGRETRSVTEALAAADLTRDLLGTHLGELAGTTIKGVAAYATWRRVAYRPRNDIIHRARANASATEAKEAFEAVVALSNAVDKILVDRI